MFRLLLISIVIGSTHQHGVFWHPPSRASLGHRTNNTCENVAINYNHMNLDCGGLVHQHALNEGRCGLCGDPYGESYRLHETPGSFATGIIGQSYFRAGELIDVEINILANYGGFFGFKLCDNNNPDKDPAPECFDKYPLLFENGERFYHIPLDEDEVKLYKLKVRLPPSVVCWQCILQWTWVTGNNWGDGPQSPDYYTKDCVDGEKKMGCGMQEVYRGCADICIGPRCPRKPCQRAKPFYEDLSKVMDTSTMIMRYACIGTNIKEEYYSILGDHYCRATCLGTRIEECNIYVCDCQLGLKAFKKTDKD